MPARGRSDNFADSATLAAPCDTIAYAIANSGPADEIVLDSGAYPEAVREEALSR